MIKQLGNLARTHTCGDLRASDVGRDVVLFGWVHRVRDLGGLLFFDLRDRHGLTQVVARSGEVLETASKLRPEFVVAISGRVERRDEKSSNAFGAERLSYFQHRFQVGGKQKPDWKLPHLGLKDELKAHQPGQGNNFRLRCAPEEHPSSVFFSTKR